MRDFLFETVLHCGEVAPVDVAGCVYAEVLNMSNQLVSLTPFKTSEFERLEPTRCEVEVVEVEKIVEVEVDRVIEAVEVDIVEVECTCDADADCPKRCSSCD